MFRNLDIVCENWINSGYYASVNQNSVEFTKMVMAGDEDELLWVEFDMLNSTYEVKRRYSEPIDMHLHCLIQATCKLFGWIE